MRTIGPRRSRGSPSCGCTRDGSTRPPNLLAGIEDSIHAAAPLAMVHLSRGHVDLAAAVLRDAIRRMVNDVMRGAALLALLVDAELARADVPAARQAADLLASMAAVVDVAACRRAGGCRRWPDPGRLR